tara:strand:+ start:195 stop:830 length:636 start_codon:yes stop_codon:yes gene_type:complete
MKSKRIVILFAILLLSVGFITPSFAEEYIEYDYSALPSLIVIPSTTTLIVTNDDTANDHRMISSAFDTGLIQYGINVNIHGEGLSGDYTWSDPISGHSGIIRVTGDSVEYTPTQTTTPVSNPEPTVVIQPTTSEDIQVVIDQTQEFKEAIENKISAQVSVQVEPLITEIAELKAENLELKSQLEKFKQLYADWRAVAMEQLKVMSDILGLF